MDQRCWTAQTKVPAEGQEVRHVSEMPTYRPSDDNGIFFTDLISCYTRTVTVFRF